MNPQNNPPMPDRGMLNDRIKTALRKHQLKARVLTTLAFTFGFVAMVASLLIVLSYLILFLPKQKELMANSEQYVTENKSHLSAEDRVKRIDYFLFSEVLLTRAMSWGMVTVALAVSALGFGTITLLTVVVLNRRVALSQITESLAQISKELRQMRSPPDPV